LYLTWQARAVEELFDEIAMVDTETNEKVITRYQLAEALTNYLIAEAAANGPCHVVPFVWCFALFALVNC
jgi:hypothetical protein